MKLRRNMIWKITFTLFVLSATTRTAIPRMLKSFWKSLRLGAEINVGNVVFLRGGLNSGYPSIGAEVRFLGFGVGFSWETIEKGLYIGDNPLSVLRLAVEIY